MSEVKKCSFCGEASFISLGPVNMCMGCIMKLVFAFFGKDKEDAAATAFHNEVVAKTKEKLAA